MTVAPFAPWALEGESVIGLARWHGRRPPLPAGLIAMPGPFLVSAVRYSRSPVGPFIQLLVGEPARLGMRPGWCLVSVVLDCQAARVGGRLNWGFPADMGTLRWVTHDNETELVWVERDIVVRGRAHGPVLPFLTPIRALQSRGDGPVVVPGHLRGRARIARVSVHTYPGDPLGPLAGRHPGLVVAGLRHVIREARHPIGLTATLRAPLRAPEPAMAGPWLPSDIGSMPVLGAALTSRSHMQAGA